MEDESFHMGIRLTSVKLNVRLKGLEARSVQRNLILLLQRKHGNGAFPKLESWIELQEKMPEHFLLMKIT